MTSSTEIIINIVKMIDCRGHELAPLFFDYTVRNTCNTGC